MREKNKKSVLNTIFIVIVLILVVLGIFSILKMFFGNNSNGDKEIEDLSEQLKEVYSDLTVYSSANKEILFIELNNWSNSYSGKLSEIIDIIKIKMKEEEFESYKKLTTITHLESNGKENALLLEYTYNLPEFTQDSKREYIIFEEYQNLYNTLNKTMEGYTGLYNSYFNN